MHIWKHIIWIHIWMQYHSITITNIDLGELAEILGHKHVCNQFHYAMIEDVQPFTSHIHLIHIKCMWSPSSSTVDGWMEAHSHYYHYLPSHAFLQIWESWLKSWDINMCTWCNCAMVEALEPFHLHPTSIWYTNNVFEHLLLQWMSASGWIFRPLPPQTFLQIWESWLKSLFTNMIWYHILFVSAPSSAVDGHHYHHTHFPRFGRVSWNPGTTKCASNTTMTMLSPCWSGPL